MARSCRLPFHVLLFDRYITDGRAMVCSSGGHLGATRAYARHERALATLDGVKRKAPWPVQSISKTRKRWGLFEDKTLQKLINCINIPYECYPQAPFMGVTEWARGVNHKRLQETTGCTIFTR